MFGRQTPIDLEVWQVEEFLVLTKFRCKVGKGTRRKGTRRPTSRIVKWLKQKEVVGEIKLQIPRCRYSSPSGWSSTLVPKALISVNSSSEFNDATAKRRGEVVPVVISVYKDKSFDFIMKEPPMAELIKKQH